MPIAGIFVSQHYGLKKLKREVKSQILQNWDRQSVETIEISNSDLVSKNVQFFEEDNEVEISGKMYDIVEQTKTGTKIILKCISDTKESEFKAKLKDQLIVLFTQNTTKNKQTKSLFQFIQSLFFETNEVFEFPKNFFSNLKVYFHYLSIISSIDIRLNSPPPESFNLF